MRHARSSKSGSWRLTAAAVAMLFLPAVAPAAEGMGGFDFGNLGQALAAVLTFLLLLVVLGRWAWKPLVAQIRAREQAVADAIHRAEKQRAEAQEFLDSYRARLDRAEDDARDVLVRTRQEAAELRDRIVAEARQEALKVAEAAKAELARAKDEAIRELYDATAELATDVAQRLLRRSLGGEDHARLLEQSVREIRDRAGGR